MFMAKTYKFVYMRKDRYDRSFDHNDFSEIRNQYPAFVIANKNPDNMMYQKGITPYMFSDLYCKNDISRKMIPEKLSEAEWTKLILQYCKLRLKECKQEMRQCEKENISHDNYYYHVRKMFLPIYKDNLKIWKKRYQKFIDDGTYMWIELSK